MVAWLGSTCLNGLDDGFTRISRLCRWPATGVTPWLLAHSREVLCHGRRGEPANVSLAHEGHTDALVAVNNFLAFCSCGDNRVGLGSASRLQPQNFRMVRSTSATPCVPRYLLCHGTPRASSLLHGRLHAAAASSPAWGLGKREERKEN